MPAKPDVAFDFGPGLAPELVIDATSTLILDLDGVVWAGSQALPGAPEAIAHFRNLGAKVTFLTNNSASAPDSIRAKLERFGILCAPEELMTSALGAARLLSRAPEAASRGTFVVGSAEFAALLERHGLLLCGPEAASAVVVGLDSAFSYARLAEALLALDRGATLIACNRDANYPAADGRRLPGCGPIIAAIEAASGHQADLVVGKPGTFLLDELLSALHLAKTGCIVVGDTLETDIAMARSAGIRAVLVAPEGAQPDPAPALVVASLRAFAERFAR